MGEAKPKAADKRRTFEGLQELRQVRTMEFSITTDAYDANQPIDDRLTHFSEAGFTYLHWSEHWTSDTVYTRAYAERVVRMADTWGLRIQNIHSVCRLDGGPPLTEQRWYELNINRIRFISWLGGDCIVLHIPLTHGPHPFESERDESERLITRLLPEAQKHRVRLAIENIESRPTPRLFDDLFETFPPEDLGFCFDSGHANMMGELDILDRYLDRLIMTHLHDNHGQEDEHLLPGEGTIDWKPMILSLKKKPDFPIVNLEVTWPGTIPKKTWCRMAYRSIHDLWEGSEQLSK
jgi:sugar phosphate isomerase/epimerase